MMDLKITVSYLHWMIFELKYLRSLFLYSVNYVSYSYLKISKAFEFSWRNYSFWMCFVNVEISICWIIIKMYLSLKNLLTSDQSCIILKSITKLPIDLAPVYYPTLLTIIWENAEAEEKLAKDFDIQVRLKEWEVFVIFINTFACLLNRC